MAVDPTDRDLLRIYADPTISPADKARLLGGGGPPIPPIAALPPQVAGLPPGAVAGPGGGAGGTSGAGDTGPGNAPAVPSPASGAGGAPSMDMQAGAQTGVTGGGTDTPVTGAQSQPSVADQRKQLEQTLSPNDLDAAKLEHPELFGGAPAPVDPATTLASTGTPGATPGNGDYRGALRLLGPAGGPVVPMEHVQQQTSVTGSTVSPDQIAALGDAAAKRDTDAMQAKIAEARIAQQGGDIQVAADQRAQAEKDALGAIRQKALDRGDQILAQQDAITNQIVNTKPVEPGMMSSKNFGDTLGVIVGGLFSALSGPKEAVDFVNKLANAEVNKQRAELDKQHDDLGQLNNLYGLHLANLKDHELAKTQTIADIYGRAQAETLAMMQQNGQAPDSVINRQLQAQASALGAQRQEYMADVQSKLGGKLVQEETVSFARKHLEPKPGVVPAAAGAPALPGATGGPRPDIHTPVGRAPQAASAEDAVNRAAELWNGGKPREALALLPPTIRTAIQAQAARSQKGLGDGATREDALAYALHDMSNGQFQIPASFIPQSAREKLVQIPGGAQGFATGKAQADKLQDEFNGDAGLVSAYSQLLALAKQPASAWTPDTRAKIDSITALIRPMTAHSLGQRGMSAQEQELFDGISGHDINGVKDFLLGTGKASAEEALQIARTRIRARARSLSRDPFDFVPIEGGN